jgi:MHS family proline/betaine transporter-like MFS transporter
MLTMNTRSDAIKNAKPLTLEEKKSLGIILTGNFLEYFDLMLFSHLAFVVSPYFMPKTDPLVVKMLTIFTFASSFVIRPFAAMFWGYVGDNFGRVVVLSYTTLIMAITCLVIPNIPSYAEWGVYSTVLIIFCRVLQGFSSAGEAKGAEIFVAEVVPHFPKIFIASVMVPITCDLGGMFATLLGSLCMSFADDGWKICFYMGVAIAFCSYISRKKLRETKEFLNYKKFQKNFKPSKLETFFEKRNFVALIGLNMICPTAFYFAYSFCSDVLKSDLGLSPNLILLSNSSLLAVEIFFLFFCARLAYKFDPFTILRVRTLASFLLMPLSFMMMFSYKSHLTVFATQLIVLLSTASFDPATPLIIRSFGIQNRFSKYSKAWAFAKAVMYLSTGYLTFYMDQLFDVWGILFLLMFFSFVFIVSLHFFVPKNKMLETYIKLTGAKPKDIFAEEDDRYADENNQGYVLKSWVEKN